MYNKYIKRIEEIVQILNNATTKYDEGNPIMSDKDWDELYFELFNLEESTGHYLKESPTQQIIFKKVSELNKIKHNHPMLSLQKTKSIEEVNQFINNKDFIVMLKLDGLTCSLKYNKGKLISAETRGNGIIGEDITHNAFVVSNIPKKIPFKGELTVDGEIICILENFKPFEKEYKNPRNFAAGSIRLLDSKECDKRNLSFIAWDVISAERVPFETLVDKLNFLFFNNFSVVNYNNEIKKLTEEFITNFKNFNIDYYPIDGLVIKYNNCKEYESAGRTDHHFKGGIAFKFYDEDYETTLLDIDWTIGRTGILTPIAVFKPVEIDGTVCERASLHNISIMRKLSGGYEWKGDKISIFKANEIIPQVRKWEHVGEFKEENCLEIPMNCPICGGICNIRKEDDVEFLKCMNELCEGKLVNRLEHFCGKKGLDIKGLSKATLEKLIDWGWVNNIVDIFNLKEKRSDWIKLPGFGIKSVDNILNAIKASKNCPLDKFISGIGIPLVGTVAAKDLKNYFGSWEEFYNAIQNNFKFFTLPNFGLELHKAIINFNYTEALELVNNHISFIAESENEKQSNTLEGKTFVITGKLVGYKNRDELKNKIEALGGKVASAISGKTSYLINNDINSKSSKNESAKKLGIPIITEENFEKML